MGSLNFTLFFIIILSTFSTQVLSECEAETTDVCVNKSAALPLKIIAIFAILATSIIGICLPLVTSSIPALGTDTKLFVIVKAFAAGIILATGFMHVFPDAVEMLSSDCLPDNPWHKYPFSFLFAMLAALVTMGVETMVTSIYAQKSGAGVKPEGEGDSEKGVASSGDVHGHHHGANFKPVGQQLLRYRVIAMTLELGIVVHSIVIGLALGASNNTCEIKPLVAALCFHQMFEGMGLGGAILQGDFKFKKKASMVSFFSLTTPVGIVIALAISKLYQENSPASLITTGILNSLSAGLLIYMALVDLLAPMFMGSKLQGSLKLTSYCLIAALLGAGGMAVMAVWA